MVADRDLAVCSVRIPGAEAGDLPEVGDEMREAAKTDPRTADPDIPGADEERSLAERVELWCDEVTRPKLVEGEFGAGKPVRPMIPSQGLAFVSGARARVAKGGKGEEHGGVHSNEAISMSTECRVVVVPAKGVTLPGSWRV